MVGRTSYIASRVEAHVLKMSAFVFLGTTNLVVLCVLLREGPDGLFILL